jgi:hypothetical protein
LRAAIERWKRQLLGAESVQNRPLRLLAASIATSMIAGLLLSYKLWLNSRMYPLTPAWPLRTRLPSPLDWILFAALLGLLILIALAPRPRFFIAIFIPLAICVAWQDQSRWQPWFYQYVAMLAVIALAARPGSALNSCRLIVAAIYFWSGLAKLNASFMTAVIPFLLEPFHLDHSIVATRLMMAAPLVESIIGVGLLIPRFRRAAVAVAILMHLFILWSLGPFGNRYNSVVWPWNLGMIAFLLILFRSPETKPAEILWNREFRFQAAVLILFCVAPALSFFNLWDDYLSFGFYAGNANSGVLQMTDEAYDQLPDALDDYVYQTVPDPSELALSDWSRDELNVPPYPEVRVLRNVGKQLCAAAGNPPGMTLVVRRKRSLASSGGATSYSCKELQR